MNEDKEIEELAEAVMLNCHACLFEDEAKKIAEYVIKEQGYRKQRTGHWVSQEEAQLMDVYKMSEQAYKNGYKKAVEDIFKEIETCFVEPFGSSNITIILDKEYFIEFKKKYTEGEK